MLTIKVLDGVALFSTLAGLMYGAWVDDASLGLVSLYLLAFIALLAGALWWVNRRNEMATLPQTR